MTESSSSPIDRLRGELNRVVDAVRLQGEKALDALNLNPMRGPWHPAVDILEKTDQVQVVVDLPGVDPTTVEVLLVANMLTIRGSRAVGSSQGTEVRAERPAGSFERASPLPSAVESDEVDAQAKWGVLTITLQKRKESPPLSVRVAVQNRE